MVEKPLLAVIGGSGLYNMSGLQNVETHDIVTPFGNPSAPIVTGDLSGRRIAFLARHGIGHHISPGEINYRANIFALKQLGVTRIVSISACGSLREDYAPGHIVIPDQLFDFTRGKRERSFFGEGLVVHISSADPFCADLSDQVYRAVKKVGAVTHRGGTFITIEGPRFSTRAESALFRSWQMSIIGMTSSPEAFLAREAEICYAAMAHVTDYDSWHTSEQPVTVEMVINTLMKNTDAAQKALQVLVESLDDDHQCSCGKAVADAIITQVDKIPDNTRQKLSLLVNKYLPN